MFQTISSWAVTSRRDFLSMSMLTIGLVLAVGEPVFAADAQSKKPLRILLITGGCCHNYAFQTQALKEAVAKLAQADWTVVNEGGTRTKAQIPLYEIPIGPRALTWWCTMNASPTRLITNTSARSLTRIRRECPL